MVPAASDNSPIIATTEINSIILKARRTSVRRAFRTVIELRIVMEMFSRDYDAGV